MLHQYAQYLGLQFCIFSSIMPFYFNVPGNYYTLAHLSRNPTNINPIALMSYEYSLPWVASSYPFPGDHFNHVKDIALPVRP